MQVLFNFFLACNLLYLFLSTISFTFTEKCCLLGNFFNKKAYLSVKEVISPLTNIDSPSSPTVVAVTVSPILKLFFNTTFYILSSCFVIISFIVMFFLSAISIFFIMLYFPSKFVFYFTC